MTDQTPTPGKGRPGCGKTYPENDIEGEFHDHWTAVADASEDVEAIVAARVAAARANERAKWVTRLDALATEYEERASHLRQYGVHSNRIADLLEAAARKLRALIEGADQ
jgi:outer membrane murein-binding lipoprotein Lpp